MCGIAGIYNNSKTVNPLHIKEMTDKMRHRGPDDEGFLALNVKTKEFDSLIGGDSRIDGQRIETYKKRSHLFLGHRRLAIIDTSSMGHQPMSNKDGTLWLIFNGEIYNYIELREELCGLGYSFKSNTDAEVLLAAYETWGEDCLKRFNGMWAFVIYDRRRNILFGSRDRFGVKPLYYYIDKDYFIFASEIKALLLPFIKREVNPRAVFDYLVLGLEENESEGFYKNIHELKPSSNFIYDIGTHKISTENYYSLEYTDRWETFSESKSYKYIEGIRELIFNAVNMRLRSDVPVGSCLSGGIDSSSIVCVVNNILKERSLEQVGKEQNVFTASFNDSLIDESNWAKIVVENTKTSWTKTLPNAKEFIKDLKDLIYTQDIPFGSTSIYAQYRVMKIAREKGVKVLLDGQGGDEVFTGYLPFHRAFFEEMIKNFSLLQSVKEFSNIHKGKKDMLLSLSKMFITKLLPLNYLKAAFRARKQMPRHLNNDFWALHSNRIEEKRGHATTSLNKMLHTYMSGPYLKSLLRYEDRNSMRFSIEARTPFADDIDLIEYLFSIPSVYKIHDGWSKFLLRQSMEGILPDAIKYRRDKIGFATPEYRWLNESKDNIRDYITDDLNEFIDTKQLLNNWETLIKSQPRQGITPIWRIINLGIWKKVYEL
ncbi:asparagine synthase (glutamine-hydrolyzing) [Candidatus Omnitrophota bacterium]